MEIPCDRISIQIPNEQGFLRFQGDVCVCKGLMSAIVKGCMRCNNGFPCEIFSHFY